MTYRQKFFCDHYIVSLNAADAAEKAGYSAKTARAVACNLMRLDEIKEYIKDRLKERESELIANQDEVLQTLSRIMRRELYVEKSYVDKITGELKTYKQYPNFIEVIRAAELLGKRYNLWNDKHVIDISDTDIHVTIDGEDD